jgi:NhaD family Na+/H+ antiporter
MPDINLFSLLMILIFILGYFFITIEHVTKINKTSIALLMAIICWLLQFINHIESHKSNLNYLAEHLANISQVIFFLLGALTIVEIINAHKGFKLISNMIRFRSKRKLLWFLGIISFFLSSVLDNLTTTIVMVTLLRKLASEGEDRLLIGGAAVIAANAGGAWTPIGDVTTTMLWIGGQLSTLAVMKVLFLPSIACLIVGLLVLSFSLQGEFSQANQKEENTMEPMGTTVFWLGIGCLIFVPIFKIATGLPPFMGMIFGLGFMWLFTDIVHSRYEHRKHLLVPHIMTRIDISGVLFFLGILLAIDALHTAGLLQSLANWMDHTIANSDVIAIVIGLVSAIIDNVPLVAAAMGMYGLSQYPTDSSFWNLIAYCAGTGGSILVIGSAAGVAFMGLERVQFFWYMRRIGFAALLGYFAGIGIFKLINMASI